MSWHKELPVTGGDGLIAPTEEEDVYRVEGLVESGEEYLIWFQRLRCPDPERQLSSLRVATKFQVAADGAQPLCTIRLRPRILSTEGPQPTSFLALCERLLAPLPTEKCYGYLCEVSLRIGPAWQVDVVISDRLNEPHEGDFVEFMHMQAPLTFIAHRKRLSFTSRDIVELVLRLKLDWPLPYEASQ